MAGIGGRQNKDGKGKGGSAPLAVFYFMNNKGGKGGKPGQGDPKMGGKPGQGGKQMPPTQKKKGKSNGSK